MFGKSLKFHGVAIALSAILAAPAWAGSTCDLTEQGGMSHEGGSESDGNASIACGWGNNHDITEDEDNIPAGDFSSAFGGDNMASGSRSNAFGYGNLASGVGSNAFGGTYRVEEPGMRRNQATGFNSNAFGSGNLAAGSTSSAFGAANTADGSGSNAFGNANTSSGGFSSAFGSNNIADGNGSLAVGISNEAIGVSSVAVGDKAQAFGDNSLAMGAWYDRNGDRFYTSDWDGDGDGDMDATSETALATAAQSVALGAGVLASGEASAAIGVNAIASADRSIAIGFGAVADRENTVSVGNKNGAMNQIVNVADGTEAHDAVNLNQLRATLATANAYTDTAVATGGTAANAYTDDREAAIRGDMQAGDAATLADANAYTDQRVGEIAGMAADFDRRMGLQDARIDRVGALGAAMVGMAASASAVEGSRTRLGVAAGTYNGKQALSVGLQQRLGGRAALTIGGAFSGSERSATVGFGFGL